MEKYKWDILKVSVRESNFHVGFQMKAGITFID